jgi:hypothetical protein
MTLLGLDRRWNRTARPVLLLVALALIAVTPTVWPVNGRFGPGWVSTALAQGPGGERLPWSVGGPGVDEARSLAVDGAGNIYLAGVFTSTIDVAPGPETMTLTGAGDSDVFLAKYDPDGRVIWAWSLGGPTADEAHAVAVDPAGNVYLAGSFSGQVDFEPGEGTAAVQAGAGGDGFIARYDASGALTWVTPISFVGEDEVLSLSLDAAGNAVAAGLAGSSMVVPSTGAGPSVRRGDVFVVRLDGNGRTSWSLVLPTQTEGVAPVGVAMSPSGEVVLATSYTGTVRVSIGSGLVDHASLGGADVLLLRLTPSGGLAWSRSFGSPGNDAPGAGGVAVDPGGNASVTGIFDGPLQVGRDLTPVLEGQSGGDLFLVSFTPDGSLRWATGVSGPGHDAGHHVVADAASYLYVTGAFSESASAGAASGARQLTGRGRAGASDVLLAKYTPDGRLAWVHGFGGQGSGPFESSSGRALAIDSRGDALLVGRFVGTDVDFDPEADLAPLSSAGQSDAFVAKYGPDGVVLRR